MRIITKDPKKVISSALGKFFDVISLTYGPAGKKVLISEEFRHEAVDDGSSVAKAFELEDEAENDVIKFIKETTEKTNEVGQDGSTTSIILLKSIYDEAKGDDFKKINPIKAEKELKLAVLEAVDQIKKKAKKVKSKEELYAIALNSYNNEKIAKLISETVHNIGEDGFITIEESGAPETTSEIVNGLEIDRGYLSRYFAKDGENEVKLSTPSIVITSQQINVVQDIAPVISILVDQGKREMLIVADDFSQDVINALELNKLQGNFCAIPIKAPGFGERRIEHLKNLAVVVGAKVIDNKQISLSDPKLEYIGSARKVVCTKDKTTIIDGAGKKEEIVERTKELKGQLKSQVNEYDKTLLKKEIASVSGGIAVIKVGGRTESEMKSTKSKVEDAVGATREAFRNGIVPGAGITFQEIKTSSEILNKALKAPRKQLEDNGKEFLDENVYDPAGVLIAALESAVSVACGLITMGAIISKKREKEKDQLS